VTSGTGLALNPDAGIPMTECRRRADSVDFRKKCRCQTDFFLTFTVNSVYVGVYNVSMYILSTTSRVWTHDVIPLSTVTVWMCRVSPFSTASTVDVQGVSLSIACRVYPTTGLALWTCRVSPPPAVQMYPFPPPAVCTAGFMYPTCTIIMQCGRYIVGVSLFTTSNYACILHPSPPSYYVFKCRNAELYGIMSVRNRDELKCRCREQSSTKVRESSPVLECSGTD
jgi:hypothetical protein